jgi:phenylacetate-coenzyme A ligase PaaK-like adenylate-forming protein
MERALRKEVIVQSKQTGLVLEDGVTGFIAEYSCDSPLPEGFLTDASITHPDVETFWECMRSLGLTAEFDQLSEIWRYQRAAIDNQLDDPADLLRRQLDFLCREVPFYVSRKQAYDSKSITTLADLDRLPFLRKRDLRSHFPDGFLPAGRSGGDLKIGITSGSTSERLQAWMAPPMPIIGMEGVYGLKPRGRRTLRTALFTTPFCAAGHCRLGQATMEARTTEGTIVKLNTPDDIFAIPAVLVHNVFEEIQAFGTECLMADPRYLHALIRRALQLGIDLPRVEVVLLCFEYATRLDRDFIRQHLCQNVLDGYGATETGEIATGCLQGNWHVRQDRLLHVEVVRESRRAELGEIGAVALTQLSGEVTPLVRYLVGDVGALLGEECGCPIGHWPRFELHGCAKDMLWIGDRWVTTRQFDDVVSACPSLAFYSAVQSAEDALEIAAIPALAGSFDPDELVDRVRSGFGLRDVRVRLTSRLEAQPSMKYRLTECRFRTPPELP